MVLSEKLMKSNKNYVQILVLTILLAIVGTAQAQKRSTGSRLDTKSARQTEVVDDFKQSFIKASEEYQASLKKLLVLYEADVRKASEQSAKWKELYTDGLISRHEYETSSNGIIEAQAKVDEVRKQLANSEMILAEARRPLRPDELQNAQMTFLAQNAPAWTTGSARIDALIRENGMRFGVDPYFIFCVIQQESSFSSSAVSVKGAQGLMQLMPATAARYGVSNASDPAQNIKGGTRYLKDLLKLFNGRVDLVLAGYNAGEGAVIKYGQTVPPYKETQDYVRLISKRYLGKSKAAPAKKTDSTKKLD